jgi:hypothetical protein
MNEAWCGFFHYLHSLSLTVPSSFHIEFLRWLKILRAIRRSRSGGLKIGGTCYKEPYLWTGTTYSVGQEPKLWSITNNEEKGTSVISLVGPDN